MNKKTFLLLGILIILVSCQKPTIYNANIDIPNESWSVDSIATFNVSISDTTSSHNIYINIRNTTNYPYSNLYLFIQTTSPKGATLRDTLECLLADHRGNWLGKGFGAIKDNQFSYKRYIRFPEQGDYVFNIQQGMRTHSLKGISSVGLVVEKKPENN